MTYQEYTLTVNETQEVLFDIELEAVWENRPHITEQVEDIKVSVVVERGIVEYWLSDDQEIDYTRSREAAAQMLINALLS